MNGIGNLLTRYVYESLARAYGRPNDSFSRPTRHVTQQTRGNEAVKVELGKDDRYLTKIRAYNRISRAPKTHPDPPAANSKAPEETSKTSQPVEPSGQIETLPTGDELDFKAVQQMNFSEFRAAWGAKDGEANYNASYDYDSNGIIDMVDWLSFGKELQNSFEEFKQAYGSKAGDDNYNGTYDYDSNGVIDMKDWLSFGKNWVA